MLTLTLALNQVLNRLLVWNSFQLEFKQKIISASVFCDIKDPRWKQDVLSTQKLMDCFLTKSRIDWLIELRFYVPPDTKYVTKYTTTWKKPKKTKARFGRLLWPPAWKRRGPILVSVLHRFVTYLLRYLPTYSPGTHMWRPKADSWMTQTNNVRQ